MDKRWWWERYRFLIVLALLGIRRLMPESPARDVLAIVILVLFVADVLWSLRVGYVRRRPHWTARSWRRFVCLFGLPLVSLVTVFVLPAVIDIPAIVGPRHSPAGKMAGAASILTFLFGLIGFFLALFWFKDGRPDKQVEWPQLRVRPTPQP